MKAHQYSVTHRSWLNVGLLVAIGVPSLASSSCAAPTAGEQTRAMATKYIAPDPILTVQASSETRNTLGIEEWRLFRGKGGVFLSGVDAAGQPVKGLVTSFTRNADGTLGDVFTRVNDGSDFALHHSMRTSARKATRSVPVSSQAFVRRAALDLALLQRIAIAKARAAAAAGTAVNPGAVCRQQLPGVLLQSLQCFNTATGACSLDAAANASGAACLGATSSTGISGSLGSLDNIGPGVCAGDPSCGATLSAVQQENFLDAQCGGSLGCIGASGGFVPLTGFSSSPGFGGPFPESGVGGAGVLGGSIGSQVGISGVAGVGGPGIAGATAGGTFPPFATLTPSSPGATAFDVAKDGVNASDPYGNGTGISPREQNGPQSNTVTQGTPNDPYANGTGISPREQNGAQDNTVTQGTPNDPYANGTGISPREQNGAQDNTTTGTPNDPYNNGDGISPREQNGNGATGDNVTNGGPNDPYDNGSGISPREQNGGGGDSNPDLNSNPNNGDVQSNQSGGDSAGAENASSGGSSGDNSSGGGAISGGDSAGAETGSFGGDNGGSSSGD
jgi:hypothetical protein